MKIQAVFVDTIPASCGACCLMDYVNDCPVCFGIADKKRRELTGNPYDMNYRRSDCPLVEGGVNE